MTGAPPAAPGDAAIFAEAARRAAAREPFVLCSVIETARSAPRDAGAKMLVCPGGDIVGTVGGGPLEASVIQDAIELLRGDAGSCTRRFALSTSGESAAPLPLHGPPVATLDAPSLGMKCGGECSVFLDVVRPPARLLLYGAGHVGERVATLASQIGLSCVVADDRPAYVSEARFPGAIERRCADLAVEPLAGLEPGPTDFVVILTRCHALDEGVLQAALSSRARYVGLIGSKRKVALLARSIAQRTGRDPREDARLHAPIGLKLGDKTPGEIAISILAELLLVKSRGELAHNRLRPKPEGAGGSSSAS